MNAHLAHLRDNGCDVRLIGELQNRPFGETSPMPLDTKAQSDVQMSYNLVSQIIVSFT